MCVEPALEGGIVLCGVSLLRGLGLLTVGLTAHNLVLQVSNIFCKGFEGGGVPHVTQFPGDGRAHGGEGSSGLLTCLRQGFLSLFICF